MKLYEGAVFLIIAGAMIGPIKALNKAGELCPETQAVCVASSNAAKHCRQWDGQNYLNSWKACITSRKGWNTDEWDPETTEETCERALQEMGAVRGFRTFPRGEGPLSPNSFFVLSDRGNQWEIEGRLAICIPAPLGLGQ